MRLEGKVALITGAATGVKEDLMGFGGATAWLFVREGAKVVLGDVNEELGQKTTQQIREDGGEALFVRMDVTSEEDWVEAVGATVSAFGRLDVLVNNAGMFTEGTPESTTGEEWDRQMAVHGRGTFLGTKHAVPALRNVGGGAIVNVSSIDGIVGGLASVAYASAKGAIRLFTKSAAIQYAGENIRVNSVHPGYFLTPMSRETFTDPQQGDWRIARVPMGKVGGPEAIAYAVLYLASDEASYVTGAELVVDGGLTAQ